MNTQITIECRQNNIKRLIIIWLGRRLCKIKGGTWFKKYSNSKKKSLILAANTCTFSHIQMPTIIKLVCRHVTNAKKLCTCWFFVSLHQLHCTLVPFFYVVCISFARRCCFILQTLLLYLLLGWYKMAESRKTCFFAYVIKACVTIIALPFYFMCREPFKRI